MKVFVEGSNISISGMMVEEGYEVTTSLKDCDFLCLAGGNDVSPELYKEENTHSHSNLSVDTPTLGLITAAKLMGKPVVGICKGAQILNVYHGGSMIQHIEGHAIRGTHELFFEDQTYDVTSTHHQCMKPDLWSDNLLGQWRVDDVPEIVIYSEEYDKNDVCFQPHPEFTQKGSSCRELFFRVLKRYGVIK